MRTIFTHSIWEPEHTELWYEAAHWQDLKYFDTYEEAAEYKEKFKGHLCYDYIVIREIEVDW